jgi:(1->4)-alpha-D-glucan 1-alpha-D-glucosylmutase
VNPYLAYDDAVRGFVTRLLAPGSPFLDTSRPFREAVARAGAVNSLAQTLLKITAPGIPDFYQGSELWDLSLVDPDNRRPVDFARRESALAGLAVRIAAESSDSSGLATELLAAWRDGLVKLYVIHRALTLRRDRARLFGVGAYVPLAAVGPLAEHVVAFARREEGEAAIVAVPRLPARLTGLDECWPLGGETWGETWLSLGDAGLAGTYRDRFTGRRLETETRDGVPGITLGALFEILPVALLEREDAA